MSKKLFDKVIEHEGRKYRYNSKEALLEWIDFEEYDLDIGEFITLDKPRVVDAIGLMRENAEAGLMEYIARWNDDIEEELAWEMKNLF